MAVSTAAASSSDCFIELVREEDGVKMRFRRKGPPVDGQAFFCLVHADSPGAQALFEKVRSEAEKLKLFSVQCDAFHHTGVVETGFATMKRSVGRCRLKHITPNTPYYIAIAFNVSKLSMARIDAAIRRDVVNELRASVFYMPDVSLMSTSVLLRVAREDQEEASAVAGFEEAARKKHRAGLDVPIIDKIQLRELKEGPTKIRAIFRVRGRSPWTQFVLPSYECVQYVAFCYQTEVLNKQSRLQNKVVPMDHRFLIYGVSDPLTGFIVNLVQQLSRFTIDAGARRLDCTTGAILDALSALGTRHAQPSLNGPWIVDWYDFLLLVIGDEYALKRIYQCATQFNGYDVEGQTLSSRVAWMVKPESRPLPRGSLLTYYADTCRLEAKDKFSLHYIPAPISAGRAIWAMMPLRAQHRASFYVPYGTHQLLTLQTAYHVAKKETLVFAVVQSFLQRTRRAHARWRLRLFVAFVDRRYEQRECRERKRLLFAGLLDRAVAQERVAQLMTLHARYHHWRRVVIYQRLGLGLERRNLNIVRLNFLRKWRLFIQPQYRVLSSENLVLPPMPVVKIHRIQQEVKVRKDGKTQSKLSWVVFSQFGPRRFSVVIDLPPKEHLTDPACSFIKDSQGRPFLPPVARLGHAVRLTRPTLGMLPVYSTRRRPQDPTAAAAGSGAAAVAAAAAGSGMPTASGSALVVVSQFRSKVQLGHMDLLMLELQRLTGYRILFFRFSWWRVLVAAWSEKRRMRQRQAAALRALFHSSSIEVRRRVYTQWQRLAAQHRLQRHAMAGSKRGSSASSRQ